VHKDENQILAKKSDSFWYRVYAAVIAVTILVISALWAFSQFFSN
jgi:hypothetical protein